MTSVDEGDPAVEAPSGCEVRALNPETRREGDGAVALWGQAQYQCSQNGSLTVRLMRMQYWVGPIQTRQKRFDAPASSDWSDVLRTDEANCGSYSARTRFYTEARHDHTDGSDSVDGSDTITACR